MSVLFSDRAQCRRYPYLLSLNGYAATFPAMPKAPEAPGGKRRRVEGAAGAESDAATLPSKLNLRDRHFREDRRALVPGCECYACRHHTRAYIYHLLNAREMLGETLLQM